MDNKEINTLSQIISVNLIKKIMTECDLTVSTIIKDNVILIGFQIENTFFPLSKIPIDGTIPS